MATRTRSDGRKAWNGAWSALTALLALSIGGAATAQWQVAPGMTQLDLEGEVYADHECNNDPLMFPQPCTVPRLYPGDFQGTCPPYAGPPVPLHAAAEITRDGGAIGMNFPSIFFDFGNGRNFDATDDSPPPLCDPGFVYATSAAKGYFEGDGLMSRSLYLYWVTEIDNLGTDGQFCMRGCLELSGTLMAHYPMPNTTRPYYLRFDLETFGDATSTDECPQMICTDCMIPDPDDPEMAAMDVAFDVNGNGPGVLFSETLDSNPFTPEPDESLPNTTYGFFAFAPGSTDIDVLVDVFSMASAYTQSPNGFDTGEATFGGSLKFRVISHDFLVGPNYWHLIPHGGPGPGYAYSVGESEVTNQQYADFLNSAEHDLGMSALSANMVFGADGEVNLPDGTPLFLPQGPLAPESRIVYTPAAPIGTRYTVDIAQGADARTYEHHPVNYVSWIGALKFCNWVTLTLGLGANERCYHEGPTRDDWHPVTITTAKWATRDLNLGERTQLARLRGVRLPMDQLRGASGWVGNQVRAFNEWYKAAAYDPQAPAFDRADPAGEIVPALHWTYGFGRDVLTPNDANYFASGDPFDDDDAFVAMYDGSAYNGPGDPLVGAGTAFATANTTNPWGLYDMSGNIAEWGQDKVASGERAVRGGHFGQLGFESAVTYREAQTLDHLSPFVGFRLVRSHAPSSYVFVPPGTLAPNPPAGGR